MAAVADIFQEDIFTRITNVHWNTGSGIFVAGAFGSENGQVAISDDGFNWISLGPLDFTDAGVNTGAFGGGVFFLAGSQGIETLDAGSDRIDRRTDAVAMASTNGRSWHRVDAAPAPGLRDSYFYKDARYQGTGFQYKLVQSHFDGPDGPTLTKFSNAGSDGKDNPAEWNGGGVFTGLPETPVGPPTRRVTMSVGNGFTVIVKENGEEQTLFSNIPDGPRYLCYGGMGTKRVFVTTGFGEKSSTIWASYNALSWAPVFEMVGTADPLLGGMPQALRRGKKA